MSNLVQVVIGKGLVFDGCFCYAHELTLLTPFQRMLLEEC